MDRHATPGHVYPNGVLEGNEVATVEPSYLGGYCPNQVTRRGQMAVFLTKTFGLQLYGP